MVLSLKLATIHTYTLQDEATSGGEQALSLTQWKDDHSTEINREPDSSDAAAGDHPPHKHDSDSEALATNIGHIMKEGKQTPPGQKKSNESGSVSKGTKAL